MKKIVLALATVLMSAQAASFTPPEPPRTFFDTSMIPPAGRVIPVPGGGDLQAALDLAEAGDVLVLEAGTTFTGPFHLPAKPAGGWIVIRTSTSDSNLPRQGIRIGPSHADLLPKLMAPVSGPAIRAAPGAHHFRFIGVEILPTPGTFTFNLVEFGVDAETEDELPHHLIFDRCYIHGDSVAGSRRGITLNGKWIAVIDSYLSDFKEVLHEAQALAGWNGSGPFKIVNNYLEASGENLLFGGADPEIADLVPSDIEVRHNHFFKPLAWRIEDPGYARTPWLVKNLLELKNARRVLISGNILENNWVHGQSGFAVLFTVRNQEGGAPWSVVEDVTFTRNIIRHSTSGFNLLGSDDDFPSQPTRRILIHDNLLLDISGERWGSPGGGRLFQFVSPPDLAGPADVEIAHNTGLHDGPIMVADGAPSMGLIYRDNIIPEGTGFLGSGTAPGLHTLSVYFPQAIYQRNVQPEGNSVVYPPDNFFPLSIDDVGFEDPDNDFRLSSISPYKNAATDGTDPGADLEALLDATAGVESGIMNRPPECRNARPDPSVLWPPNHALVRVRITAVTDPDADPVVILITEVTHNEADQGVGDGEEPDIVIEGDSVLLRAERRGDGQGRVYQIRFVATDALGGSCGGTVNVVVPHSNRKHR